MWSHIKKNAKHTGNDVALIGDKQAYTYGELVLAVRHVAEQLAEFKHQVLALYVENCPEWVVVDLACEKADIILLPLPSFFSDLQLIHAMKEAGASVVIHAQDDRMSSLLDLHRRVDICDKFILSTTSIAPVSLPDQTTKITYTSGSTGDPKGVCLSKEQQLSVASALKDVVGLQAKKHLALLPFSTLLENVAGVYLTLLSAGAVLVLPQNSMGFNGSSGLNIEALLNTLSEHQPNSLIVLPELLLALIKSIENGWQPPSSLEFIAVGGSKVSPVLLKRAKQLGLPVYEGYGLSECSSVVSLNAQENLKIGSVGKPLKHVSVQVDNGEVLISGNTFLGYVNQPRTWGQKILATGDLGYVDDDGYLFIDGRKKNLLISSFGRNINPEWVESCVLSDSLFKQCVVFGDARPFCTALIYPTNLPMDGTEIQQCIDSINVTLPDYAQIKKWHVLDAPLTVEAGLLTANGRPKRHVILHAYKPQLEKLYDIELQTA
ncbi:MAG: AMP-binding protein [Cycloclasticus sp.]|nr:AMP-binding protein [Cycloclasticus sp.]